MDLISNARKLANFIAGLQQFETIYLEDNFCYNHIGALFVDITLQSGLNYGTVVKPRVQRVLLNYYDANTTKKFKILIDEIGLHHIIKWKDHVKLNRIDRLIEFALLNEIETCMDFKKFLSHPQNQSRFLELNGVGNKTVDYTLKLLNFDTVAVDRHIYSFVELADIQVKDYISTKKVVEFAADFLQVPRSAMDYSIWKFMSTDVKSRPKAQLELELF